MEYKPRFVPYIQAACDQKKAIFSIESSEMIDVLDGTFDDFPYKERCLVSAWMTIHKQTLMQNWESLEIEPNIQLKNIRPLQ
ncbi:MAG: DUF4160 domain-containing protein [Candidatus Protochlamydia sp.]|nr:DUF4160 domain-containing protein [Candidatus Protochlamydia sp.]